MKYQIKTYYQVERLLDVEADSAKEAMLIAWRTPPKLNDLNHNENGEVFIVGECPEIIAGEYKEEGLSHEDLGHFNWWDLAREGL